MGGGKLRVIKDAGLNLFLNNKFDLTYIVESADWVIKWDGNYITRCLNNAGLINARISASCLMLTKQIIHFGSLNTLLTEKGCKKVHPSNKVVATIFHLIPNDQRLKFIKGLNEIVSYFHTSCSITQKKLIDCGADQGKIIKIPLGVDLSLFSSVSHAKKKNLKTKFEIPHDKIVIGSFQKDGVGWKEGMEPKLIKGPDVFVKSVEMLSKKFPVFVLLVGPARGYVQKGLKSLNIPYQCTGYLKNYADISEYYNILDLYLITSRIEGGPKQILESWASGIPVVSTKVGMVPDIAIDEKNVLLANIDNPDEMAKQSERMIEDHGLRERLIKNALGEVKKYSWSNISNRYYHEIYSKL